MYIERLSAENIFDIGLRYEALGEYDLASRYFGRAVEKRPDWAEARYHLGMAYARLKRKDAAWEQYEALQSFRVFSLLLSVRYFRSRRVQSLVHETHAREV